MTPASKRRWFRFSFSLRTLFAVVTVAAIMSPRMAKEYVDWKEKRQLEADLEAISPILGQTDGVLYYYTTEEDWERSRREHAEINRQLREALQKSKLKW